MELVTLPSTSNYRHVICVAVRKVELCTNLKHQEGLMCATCPYGFSMNNAIEIIGAIAKWKNLPKP